MSRRKLVIAALLLLLLAAGFYFFRSKQEQVQIPAPPPPTEIPIPSATMVPTPTPVAKPTVVKKPTLPKPKATPSAVEIHEELIPKDIQIVRVYYGEGYSITGPDSVMEFDINGSGFNQEFRKMITVKSGSDDISVTSLQLVTPNQIHGRLKVGSKTKTALYNPQVLIQNKVVFQATDPYAVIRLGEILTLIFTEMSESGRSGRFRIFTNLSQGLFESMMVEPSTAVIQISDIHPNLPYVVEGTLNVGNSPGGTYGLKVLIDGNVVWSREDIIRVVRPNVGSAGLAQTLKAQDGFHRPGDRAMFVLQGSGFLADDVAQMKVHVPNMSNVVSSFTYISPGRMLIALNLPANAAPGSYALEVTQSSETVIKSDHAFQVVNRNWVRAVRTEPALVPGGKSRLQLEGRDLDQTFVDSIKVDTDEPALKVGIFTRETAERATADISAGANLKAGDYWLKLTAGSQAVTPELGSIIRLVNP